MLFIKKKSLGQHFLTSSTIAGKIADAARLTNKDIVLEVGPGGGILTRELLKRMGKVIAIEKDDRLIEPLTKQFAKEISAKQLVIIHGDALQIDQATMGLSAGKYSVVANIPYYITGALIRKLLESSVYPKQMVLLVQKEVAERIARDRKESLLSLSIKAYGTPYYVATVKRGSFSPVPAVDSAILRIDGISKKNFTRFSEKHFFEVLRIGFAHKRKLLSGNLGGFFGKGKVQQVFQTLGISPKARAEELSLKKWFKLGISLK